MQIRTAGMWRIGTVLLALGSTVACTVDRQEAPPFTGPSTTALAVVLSASPDMLAHNGSAQALVTVFMHDEDGDPVSGQRVSLGSSVGTLSHVDVVTGSDGRASFVVTAPALATPADKITVSATPVGSNFDNALPRLLTIGLTGTLNATRPSPAFTLAPEVLKAPGAVVVDASGTTDEGETCGDRCT